MKFIKTKLEGAYFIELEKANDERGFFSVMWDKQKFQENNLNVSLTESNIAFTKNKGTIRGLHYQSSPYEGAKLVRCTKGKVWDVTLDLRPNSKTFKKWFGITLSEKNYKMIYVPEGFAHGFQSTVDNSEIIYQVSEFYTPGYELGIHWNDSTFKIKWPIDEKIITEKDNSWKPFDEGVLI